MSAKDNSPFVPGNQYAKGHGRPKGSGTRQRLFRELIAPRQDILVNKALELAEAGDSSMLRLFLERMLPPKYQPENLAIEGATTSATIKNLVSYTESGDLTPDDASKIASIIHKDAEINNQEVMIGKLTNLEQAMEANNKVNINLNTEVKADGQEMDK